MHSDTNRHQSNERRDANGYPKHCEKGAKGTKPHTAERHFERKREDTHVMLQTGKKHELFHHPLEIYR